MAASGTTPLHTLCGNPEISPSRRPVPPTRSMLSCRTHTPLPIAFQTTTMFFAIASWLAGPSSAFLLPSVSSLSSLGTFSQPQSQFLTRLCGSVSGEACVRVGWPCLGYLSRKDQLLNQQSSVLMLAKGGKKKKAPGTICENKDAKFRYEITERLECGVALVGTEVKSCRQGKINIKDAFARVDKDGQLKLFNCHIARHFTTGAYFNHEEVRTRVLLANRLEINKILKSQEVKGFTLIPLRMYFNSYGFLKCEIGVCKGKNMADKRSTIKSRDQGRDMKRELKAAGY